MEPRRMIQINYNKLCYILFVFLRTIGQIVLIFLFIYYNYLNFLYHSHLGWEILFNVSTKLKNQIEFFRYLLDTHFKIYSFKIIIILRFPYSSF